MILSTQLNSLKKLHAGKVRDIYEIDNERLLLIATDRLSAFDVIFAEGVPEKGQILTALSLFWFEWLENNIPNLKHHILPIAPEDIVSAKERDIVAGRALVVRRTKPLPVEAVVRGYLAGSGWKSYQKNGQLCGITLLVGLAQSAKLATPIFTPATKAEMGEHDENITFAKMTEKVGTTLATRIHNLSIDIYQKAYTYAYNRGIIIADTKFEFGVANDAHGQETLFLIDEVLTPDSSRYWAINDYDEGISPPSFDKQFVRDYLLRLAWNQEPPPPPLPKQIVDTLSQKYAQVFAILQQASQP